MSTTFWMSNQKVPFNETECKTDSYSQELDIQEAVGGGTTEEKFRNGMNSNTHFRYIRCGKEKEEFISIGTGATLHSEVSDDYHIYGAWWKNANEVLFYANDDLFDTVMVRTDISEKPFDRPMKINMVTETYNWQPPPPKEDLLNDAINTAYYDWVRSYILVPIGQEVESKTSVKIYEEGISISKINSSQLKSRKITFDYFYKANLDREIIVKIKSKEKQFQSTALKALKGYGSGTYTLPISFIPEKGKSYTLEVSIDKITRTQSMNFDYTE